MCGCPARGCLEAIPSGGEYKIQHFQHQKPIDANTEKESLFFFFGQMMISERAECALSVDCVEKCSPAQSKES